MSSFKDITEPTKLLDRGEVLSRPSPVPALPGVYGWYFKEIPPGVPVDGCIKHDGLTLLYVGISPRRPSADGKSGQNLRKRIRAHYGPGQGKAHEPMLVEAFVAQPPVEALDVGILHGLAGSMKCSCTPWVVSPSVQDPPGEFRAVVYSDQLRQATVNGQSV